MEKFSKEINREYPTLVQFYSTDYPHYEKMNGVLATLEQEKNFVNVLQIDIDDPERKNIIEHYQIEEAPTYILFSKGKDVWRDTGEMSLNKLKEMVNRHR